MASAQHLDLVVAGFLAKRMPWVLARTRSGRSAVDSLKLASNRPPFMLRRVPFGVFPDPAKVMGQFLALVGQMSIDITGIAAEPHQGLERLSGVPIFVHEPDITNRNGPILVHIVFHDLEARLDGCDGDLELAAEENQVCPLELITHVDGKVDRAGVRHALYLG